MGMYRELHSLAERQWEDTSNSRSRAAHLICTCVFLSPNNSVELCIELLCKPRPYFVDCSWIQICQLLKNIDSKSLFHRLCWKKRHNCQDTNPGQGMLIFFIPSCWKTLAYKYDQSWFQKFLFLLSWVKKITLPIFKLDSRSLEECLRS